MVLVLRELRQVSAGRMNEEGEQSRVRDTNFQCY